MFRGSVRLFSPVSRQYFKSVAPVASFSSFRTEVIRSVPRIDVFSRNYAKEKDFKELLMKDTETPKKNVSLPNKEVISMLHAFRNVTINQQPSKDELTTLRNRDVDLVTKWQFMVQLLVTAKQSVIIQHGLQDMEQFKRVLYKAIKQTREGPEILAIHQQNWDDWISFVFPKLNLDFSKEPISKTKMIRIIDQLLEEITSQEFIKDVSKIVNSRTLSVQDKGRELLMEVSNRHRAIMARYGFKGEEGYIECQRSLVVHFFGDEDINALSHNVSKVVFNFTSRMIQPSANVYN